MSMSMSMSMSMPMSMSLLNSQFNSMSMSMLVSLIIFNFQCLFQWQHSIQFNVSVNVNPLSICFWANDNGHVYFSSQCQFTLNLYLVKSNLPCILLYVLILVKWCFILVFGCQTLITFEPFKPVISYFFLGREKVSKTLENRGPGVVFATGRC